MTAPMPAPVPEPAAPAPQQVQAPVQDQTQSPTESPPGGGQSATDAAAESGDPMAWLAAAEMDARFETVDRPMLQTGQVG